MTLNLHNTTAEGVADTGRCCHLGGRTLPDRALLLWIPQGSAAVRSGRSSRCVSFVLHARSVKPSFCFALVHPAHEMIESDGAASTLSHCVQNRRCCYMCAHPGMHNLPCRIAVLTSFGFASGFASAMLWVFHEWPRPLHITAESTRGQGGVKEQDIRVQRCSESTVFSCKEIHPFQAGTGS